MPDASFPPPSAALCRADSAIRGRRTSTERRARMVVHPSARTAA